MEHLKINIMDNQQDYILTTEQIQVLLTGTLGDGCITIHESGTASYSTRCIHTSYLRIKKKLLGSLVLSDIKVIPNTGLGTNPIGTFNTRRSKDIAVLHKLSLENKLKLLTPLGLALWIYDDGSLHKTKEFYNICTHSIDAETQKSVIIPYLKDNFNIIAKLTIERKLDGREFYYLRVSRHEGAYEISLLLRKYYVGCFNYKMWSSQTIQKWSKLKAQLKSEGREVSYRKFSNMFNSLQDIVESV